MRRAIAIMLTLLGTWAFAEPSSQVRYLMAKPVSEFDFGLYQLGENLTQSHRVYPITGASAKVEASAAYDWDRNRIVVTIFLLTTLLAPTTADAKAICRMAIGDARIAAGVDPKTGKLFELIDNAAAWFGPRSFASKDEPEGTRDEVLAIIELKAFVYRAQGKTGNLSPATACEGRLLSADTLFKD